MSKLKLDLPTLQNWDCHNCSGCCRQHGVFITPEEKARIESQGWTAEHGIPANQPLVLKHKTGMFSAASYRLAQQPDGACVFLNEQGLCRIHARFEEAAKPLACRIYPYAFHPKSRQVTVGLRFSCPSVVRNLGTPVVQQAKNIQHIADLALKNTDRDIAAPRLTNTESPDWPDILQFVEALDQTLATRDDFTTKLLRALNWIKLVSESKFDKVRGPRLTEFLQLIRDAVAADTPASTETPPRPPAVARVQFRLLVAQYARKDTFADIEAGIRGRWKMLLTALKFARGRGVVPALLDGCVGVQFLALERPFGGLPAEADEIFTRYFRIKIQSMHFCGKAYYDIPLVEGFVSLALIFPTILWLARWRAASQDREVLGVDDVVTAITIADHHHGYSPAFGMSGFRRRVRILDQLGAVTTLCRWYAK
ncbi:MAG: YkgJ family cysteine cluster protein [Planctomycetota bacterium]|nr:YkgJ family cysteine cluster protein [Planctomycetota bacterium]